MKFSPEGVKFIGSWEALFLAAYDDATEKVVAPGGAVLGVLTIGRGHTTAAGPPIVVRGMTITEQYATDILARDLGAVEQEVARYIKPDLSQFQFDAVGSFQYNTGWLGHPHCSLTDALNAGRYDVAAADFALYDRASGRVMRGLVRRRHAEADIFTKGIYTGP